MRAGRWNRAFQRGRGRGWSTRPAPPKVLAQPVGALLQSLGVDDLEDDSMAFKETAQILDCSFVASYNWLDSNARHPALLVPGKPPRWTPLQEATQLREDSGQYFRDQNAARYPRHPMEPSIKVALDVAPTKCIGLDVVACGSTLGNLLRFIRGQDKLFRILVEVVHGTVFFIRRENSPNELIEGVRGYGHSFPEAYTTWDPNVKGSASHQRLVRYSFGGLEIMVRFEGDGYIPEKEAVQNTSGPRFDPADDTAIHSLVEQLSTNTMSPQTFPSSQSELDINHAGEEIGQSLIFDLKTRSTRKKDLDVLGEELPRLWVSQIPKFILAWHKDGMFEEIEIHDAREDIKAWERAHNDDLAMLAALLHRIINLACKQPDVKLELRHAMQGKLEVRKQCPDVSSALSEEVNELWMRKGSSKDLPSNTEAADLSWAGTGQEDYTACTEDCGYCGRCTY